MFTRRRLTGALVVTGVLALCIGAPLAVLAGFPAVDIAIAKSHQGNFSVGANGTFTVTLSDSSITGGGLLASDGFTVTDTLPNGLSYVTAGGPSFSCTNSGQTVTCTGTPTFTLSQTHTFTLVAGVGVAAVPSVTNSVSFHDAVGADTNRSNNSATDVATVLGLPGSSTTTTTTTSTTPTSSSTTSSSSSSTGTVSPTTTIAPPTVGVTPGPGPGSRGVGLVLALVAVVAVLGSALGLSALRRR